MAEHLEAGVLLGAAVLQAAFGLFLLVRRPRVEWAAVVAILFVFNGALSFVGALAGWGFVSFRFPVGAGDRLTSYFDRATTYLVAYLALAYPYRPAALRRRPWVLPALFGAIIALVWLAEATIDPRVLRGYDPDTGVGTFSLFSVLAYDLPAGVVFPLLLVRWGELLPRTTSPVGRRQFAYLFAAFGMRGAHVIVLQVINIFVKVHVGVLGCVLAPGCGWLALEDTLQALNVALVAAALVWTAVHLAVRRARAGSDHQKDIGLVLLFLAAGAGEALLSSVHSVFASEYFTSAVVNLDLVAVRPALVWLAIMRYDLLSLRTDARRWGLRILAVLTGVSVGLGLLPPLEHALHPEAFAVAASVALGLTFAALVVVLVRPFLRGGEPERETVARYVAALEDAYRNGDPSPDQAAGLARLRLTLAIPEPEARALESAVRTRWGTPLRQDWLPGDTILGRYVIERLLGAGTGGHAYLAHDPIDGRAVVLKRMASVDAGVRRTLLHEATALERLRHPNIVRLLRVESLGDEPVLVLEHLPGGSLKDRLQEGPMRPAAALAMMDDVLAGLAAAHAAGVVHRDLKPSNVLFDGGGRAKVADFGVALDVGAGTLDLGDATRTGPGAGSLRYMAPEQVRGLEATASSDVYAAGVLLAEALLGHHPLPGGLRDYELRTALVKGLAARVPTAWPADLKRLLKRALSVDPAVRPESADALRHELARLSSS